MSKPRIETVESDILIIGGGMAGCGAAYEAAYWGRGLKTVLVEKAAIERSGAVAQGLSAINLYLGMRNADKTPEDFVRYVRGDLMGLCREDLLYDIARHVDASVHMFEEWGLPIWKDDQDRYVREGPWQVMIHGESYKPIVAEAARTALGPENIYERIFVSHLLRDDAQENRIAGAVGFSVRENAIYVFRAKAVINVTGGATALFRPKNVGEGMGRTWFTVFNTGSSYGSMIQAGAEATQMEHRFVPTRFKDGYGPVGAWFLLFKAHAENALGEDYTKTRAADLEEYLPYGAARPTPTPLRNHQMLQELLAGKGPIYMRTDTAIQALAQGGDPRRLKELESEAWEDFLDMTISQAMVWAANNIEPEKVPSEIVATEPYIMGSHSGGSGMWVSGPPDMAPQDYQWGYNRMTTVEGLFTAGDGAGASAHKFSSGSFTEGRIAAKSAVQYVHDHPQSVSPGDVAPITERVWQPLVRFEEGQKGSTRPDVNPNYLLPKAGLLRLQKLMDEYAAGLSTWYRTNRPMLERGLYYLGLLKEDLAQAGARDLHELLRVFELEHRVWTAEAHMRHMLFREETRWPGYYYRTDFPKIDDASWHVFVNSRYDPGTGEWQCYKRACHELV